MGTALECPECGKCSKHTESPHPYYFDVMHDEWEFAGYDHEEGHTPPLPDGELFICPCGKALCLIMDRNAPRDFPSNLYRWYRYDPKGWT